MTTVKPLILVVGALLLLGKGKVVVALDQAVHGDEQLLSGGLEGFKGFEGRQFSSLVGTAPWLQGAGHLLRLFGEGRFDNQPVMILIMVMFMIIITRQGRQRSVVGTILTTVLQLLGFEQNQLGSRALDMVGIVIFIIIIIIIIQGVFFHWYPP